MNESDARAALRARGIRNPSPQLVEDYMRVQRAEEWALEVPDSTQEAPSEPSASHPSSESNLEPLLRDRGELVRPEGRRKAGRPRILAPWFQAVAMRMADGTPLREALRLTGITGLSARQVRSLYRNRAFQALYREARRKFLADYGRRSPQALRKMRRYAGL